MSNPWLIGLQPKKKAFRTQLQRSPTAIADDLKQLNKGGSIPGTKLVKKEQLHLKSIIPNS